MRTLFLTIALLLFCNLSYAEVVTAKGEYIYLGDISRNEGCKLAKERAKLKALERVLGQTISSDELEKCSTVDGKTNCERNQFFLSSFGGVITNLKEINKTETSKKLDNGEQYNICLIEIRANVEKSVQELDPSFDFNVMLNEYNFRDGDNLTIDVELNKPMYLTIFQILPYEDKDYQVVKLFPNDLEKDNYIKAKDLKLPKNAKYEIYFPEKINKESIDEYLFFVGSKNNIKWLDKYSKIEDLKKVYIKNNLLKYQYKEYTIIK